MKAVLIPLKFQKLVKPRKKRKAKSKTEPTVKVLIFTRLLGTHIRDSNNSFKSGIGTKFICLG